MHKTLFFTLLDFGFLNELCEKGFVQFKTQQSLSRDVDRFSNPGASSSTVGIICSPPPGLNRVNNSGRDRASPDPPIAKLLLSKNYYIEIEIVVAMESP